MKVNVLKIDGSQGSTELNLNPDSKISDYAISIVSRVTKQNLKQGTKKAKGRSEVNGRSAKPFKQKGTGNARQGSRKGPHMRGGGVAHGPKPDFRKLAMNKKFSKLVLRKLVSRFIETEAFALIDLDSKGREARKKITGKSVIVYSMANKSNTYPFRNVEGVTLIEADSLNPGILLTAKNLYIDSSIKNKLEELLK